MAGVAFLVALRFAISAGAVAAGLLVAFLCLRFSRAAGFAHLRWFAVLSMAISAYCVSTVSTLVSDPIWVVQGALGVLVTANIALAAWLRYTQHALGGRGTALYTTFYVAVFISTAGAFVPGLYFTGETSTHEFAWLGLSYYDATPTPLGRTAMGIGVAVLFWLIALYSSAALRRVPGARVQLACLVLLTSAGINDTVSLLHIAPTPYLLPLGFLLVILVFWSELTTQFVSAATELDRLSHSLEEQVRARTVELTTARAQLLEIEKMAALGRLAAGVAHEVNNPAVAVLYNLEYVLANKDDPALHVGDEARECLKDSREGILRIAALVRQLLDAGRVASHTPLEPVQVRAIAERAVKTAYARVDDRVALELELAGDPWVLGQAQVLEQVLLNLLINGAQALPPERQDGRVRVTAEVVGERVAIVVSDNGCGIPEDMQRRVFEPFFTTKPFGQGTGLGLAVSLGIVRSLGGELTLESEVGVGTRVSVVLRESAAA